MRLAGNVPIILVRTKVKTGSIAKSRGLGAQKVMV